MQSKIEQPETMAKPEREATFAAPLGSAKWLRLAHQACMIGAAIVAAKQSGWQIAFWAAVSLFSAWSADKVISPNDGDQVLRESGRTSDGPKI